MSELDKKRLMAGMAVFAWLAQAAYVVFPIDLLPDFIPLIGWIDDLVALVGLGVTTVWAFKVVREARFPELFTSKPDVIDAEPYEPIPPDVIRSL